MNNTSRNRQPKGQPIGGQFAAETRQETSVSLGAPAPAALTFEQVKTAVAVTSIAEPADEYLGRVLAKYGGPGDDAYAAFIADLEAGGEIPRSETATATEHELKVAYWRAHFSSGSVDRAAQRAMREGIGVLTPGRDGWSTRMSDRLGYSAPLALFTRGDASLIDGMDNAAFVGARAQTSYGEHVTAEFAGGASDAGATIVSGGAYGVDGVAHRAALAHGAPTVAFLAGGVDRFYPTGHEDLLGRVAETGLVVSELPPGSTPTKHRFLARNRLIAAASNAVIVTEAGLSSGSLNTASHAHRQGVLVGAVPGPITSPASAGTNQLLSEGARVIQSRDDVFRIIRNGRDEQR